MKVFEKVCNLGLDARGIRVNTGKFRSQNDTDCDCRPSRRWQDRLRRKKR